MCVIVKYFQCLTVQTYNLPTQAMEIKVTNFLEIMIFYHSNTY